MVDDWEVARDGETVEDVKSRQAEQPASLCIVDEGRYLFRPAQRSWHPCHGPDRADLELRDFYELTGHGQDFPAVARHQTLRTSLLYVGSFGMTIGILMVGWGMLEDSPDFLAAGGVVLGVGVAATLSLPFLKPTAAVSIVEARRWADEYNAQQGGVGSASVLASGASWEATKLRARGTPASDELRFVVPVVHLGF